MEMTNSYLGLNTVDEGEGGVTDVPCATGWMISESG